ncbi:sensor histidine kinase [Paenibacillus xylaniclasticus]|uniref:sensor histidine kinase n=1 Tax=Paenibacillus xylaniclasticus TaxID=588083 RepID=UPI000FDAE7DC|nr:MULTISPECIES: sensor histidine kinase [Paenibacillus]GFN33897.1 putative two-component sensor kinase [Paenibacillus curdlanolyticus]
MLNMGRFNTLRNQMLFGFLLVMIIILSVVGIVTFDSVSRLLKNNAEKHIQQTAIQANGRLDAVLNQIDSLSIMVASNLNVQRLLVNELHGKRSTFSEKQMLSPYVNNIQIYSSGVRSVELFTNDYRRLFPLDGDSLETKIEAKWITEARAQKGRLVWIGIDPQDSTSVLAIRQISLLDENFALGGYMLIRMELNLFDIREMNSDESTRETMLLVGRDYKLIAPVNHDLRMEDIKLLVDSEHPIVTVEERKYMMVRHQSEVTGWTFLILTPLSAITEGISFLRTVIFVSAGIGTVLYIILSLFLSTIISRPIFRLIKIMRSSRIGGLKPIAQVSSTIEINELNHTYNQMVEHMNDLIRLVYEKEILQSRSELKALQAQINPHFLFNTLEALYWSLYNKDEVELAEFVIAMSELFRYTITGPNRDEWVTLEEELDHIERYLVIMRIRFGERLTWRIESLSDYARYRLPKLLVQPFVENAILHGIESKIGPGVVTVRVDLSDDHEYLKITVEDDGGGMSEDTLSRLQYSLENGKVHTSKGSGLGISNVRDRIRLYFGGQHGDKVGIQIWSREGKGTAVSISIPVITGVYKRDEENIINCG